MPGPVDQIVASTTDFRAATVRQATASQVTSIAWQTTTPAEPGPDEIRIAVTAAGLNFRDVMWAMGMLPEEALEDGFAGPTIGMECAGYVEAVGARVKDLAVGDAVMAVAPAAFSTHVCVKRARRCQTSGRSRHRGGRNPAGRVPDRLLFHCRACAPSCRRNDPDPRRCRRCRPGRTADRKGARRQGHRNGGLDRKTPVA